MAKKPSVKHKTRKHIARTQREAQQIRLIVIVTIVVAVIILGLVAYGAIDQLVIRPRQPVAEVGDTVITVRDYETFVRYTRAQLLNQVFQYYTFYQQFGEFGGNFLQTAQSLASELAQPETLARSILDEMIDNELIKQEAERLGITASDQEIEQAIQAAFGFFPDGTPTPTLTATLQPTPTLSETQLALITLTPTPTQVEGEGDESVSTPTPNNDTEIDQPENGEQILPDETPTVTLTPTPYTTEAFGENIREFNASYSAYNFDINDLREVFKVQILREKITEVITEDLDPLREEVWARHILVETEEEALEVLSLLEDGDDFHNLAEQFSQDESNRERGGDLGWFPEGMMVEPFSDVAFNLDIGEISEPVETLFGYHIIQVLGNRESQIPPPEFDQLKRAEFSAWLSELRIARDDIIIHDAWQRNIPRTPEIPQQLMVELFQQQQNIFPQIAP